MADLHKLSVQESLNAMGPGGVWDIQAVSTEHSDTTAGSTIHLDVSGYSQIGVYAAGNIYFRFSADSGSDCVAANDMVIDGSTLTFVTIPNGLGTTIYFNHLGVSTTTVKVVLV
jgi:hypothetical protein